ncbi:aspartic peptidase domain-containing protein [Massariosphaeria phaeospora]|uniref:Aspartic peptidase domain-containing protein n=1 Tax=Massariosphaeria phaeospora TaxID=100035 RepID=A0A7C8MAV8_9PLEO|nr:aspartic peptidase domain-containing protein [Massariosphaeria phaeospora]
MVPPRGAQRVLLALLAVSTTLLWPGRAEAVEGRDSDRTAIAAPVSVAPNQDWDGIDGAWNTFSLRVGEPFQWARVGVSTASQQTWVVNSFACAHNETDEATGKKVAKFDDACNDSRGRTFNTSASTTWTDNGFFQLWLEKTLDLVGNGNFGYDTVGLGLPGEEGPTVKNVVVGTLITENFWLGHFGVNPKLTNFSAFKDPAPSYMTKLFEQKDIPSLSFGYTAGARYRLGTVLGSLTLGGYDAARLIPNDLTFGFAPDNERDIVVGVVGIHANTTTTTNVDLKKHDDFTMYIDSSIAELWLPVQVCHAFEEAFGLKYDNDTELYLVDNLLHETLLAQNASITFSIGQKWASDTIIDITLPYAALDLEAKPPYRGLENTTRYFPIRRGDNETQFVLGRTFLQEAYLTVDWERHNFSVSQVNWTYAPPKNIIPIISPSLTSDDSANSGSLPKGAIIGIAVGGGFIFALAACGIVWWLRRRRHSRNLAKAKAENKAKTATTSKAPSTEKPDEPPTSPIADPEEGSNVFPKAELPTEHTAAVELSPTTKDGDSGTFGIPSPVVEVENTERQIFEMPGDVPALQEVDGRQLSEKESMIARERRINGLGPTGPPLVSPLLEAPPRRVLISPSEVTMVNRTLPNVSPITPRAPRDGAFLEASDTFFQPAPPPRYPRDGRFLEAEDTLFSPISPLERSADTSRRRFSYEE